VTQTTPLEGVDVVLADLDGVLYRGALPITHAVESLRKAAKTTRVGYVTNNAARTPGEVAQQIASYGLSVKPEDVVTSPQAAIRVLARAVPAGSTILVVGGRGLIEEVRNAGFVVTTQADDKPAAVVQGFAPSVGGNSSHKRRLPYSGWKHCPGLRLTQTGRSPSVEV